MNGYLLDTNTCIEYLRRSNSRLVARIEKARRRRVRLCSIVVSELYYGAHCSSDQAGNVAVIDELLETLISLQFDDRAVRNFGQLRRTLESTGSIIGPFDLQIAPIALANDLTVVTHNISEFTRVPGLAVEDGQS
ncbi:MAG: type II toxin-antitoxin system VapC family toxin [Pirellulaceae bacterium]|nr:type II toxin-antitoxin system VapC family toxin [Pirellulaceae bacterium]